MFSNSTPLAYPGNSDSPALPSRYRAGRGHINRVFIQETKETVIQKPSGISYAIPIIHVHELLKKVRFDESN